jgi:hypothetical protein
MKHWLRTCFFGILKDNPKRKFGFNILNLSIEIYKKLVVFKLSNEQEKFVFYQYLKFFWKRKLVLILVPVLMALLFVGVYYLVFYEEVYVGKSSIYTGAVVADSIANPTNLQGKYKEDVEKVPGITSFQISNTGFGYLSVNIVGEKSNEVYNQLDKVTSRIETVLVEEANQRLKVTEDKIKLFESHIELLQRYIENPNEVNNSMNELGEDYNINSKGEALLEQTSLARSIHDMKTDITFYENPEILTVNHEKSKSYIVESALIGLIIGAILALVLLILLKYIHDARNYFQSK